MLTPLPLEGINIDAIGQNVAPVHGSTIQNIYRDNQDIFALIKPSQS